MIWEALALERLSGIVNQHSAQSDQAATRIFIQVFGLRLEPRWAADVIAIHARYISTGASLQSHIQGKGEVGQPHNADLKRKCTGCRSYLLIKILLEAGRRQEQHFKFPECLGLQ
jgi:hypothetical protein